MIERRGFIGGTLALSALSATTILARATPPLEMHTSPANAGAHDAADTARKSESVFILLPQRNKSMLPLLMTLQDHTVPSAPEYTFVSSS